MSEFNSESLDPEQLTAATLGVDDPGLTAFALGELEGAEAEAYADRVRQSPDLQALVKMIQAEARMLSAELRLEPVTPIAHDRRAAIAAHAAHDGALPVRERQTSQSHRWVRWLAVATGSAAVVTAVALSLPRARQTSISFYDESPALRSLATATGEPKTAGPQSLGFADGERDQADLSVATEDLKMPDDSSSDASVESTIALERLDNLQAGGRKFDVDSKPELNPAQGRESNRSTVKAKSNVASGESRPVAAPAVNLPILDGFNQHSTSTIESRKAEEFVQPLKQPVLTGSGVSQGNQGLSDKRMQLPASTSLPTVASSKSGGGANEKDEVALSQFKTSKVTAADDSEVSFDRDDAGNLGGKGPVGRMRKPDSGKSKPDSVVGPQAAAFDSASPGDKPSKNPSSGSGSSLSKGYESGPPRDLVRRADYPKQGTIVGLEAPHVFDTTPGKSGDALRGVKGLEQKGDGKPASSAPVANPKSDPQKTLKDSLPAKANEPITFTLQRQLDGEKPAAEGESEDSSKSDSNEGLKRRKSEEVALAELSRARDAERRHPGSIPLEELQQLERASEKARPAQPDPVGAENYQPIFENSFISPAREPLSTFSIDVDSASYANMRRFLTSGQVPPADAVRIEELVNYFAYQYPVPQDGKPFSVNADIAACPWSPGHNLVRIGLKGKEIPKEQRPPSSLVFLVDVSGSMSAENKLPLVRSSLKTLVSQLDERDRIAIVTYAGEAAIRLPLTQLTQRQAVLAAIDALGAGGSTNGAAGINTAYDIAAKEFIEKGTNRVILCTDGDFNVGVTSDNALVQMIQTRAKGGVFLSVFGFGMGNLKDGKLEQLADKGNGQYGYIDDRQEADKIFVQELSGTLVTIAKDVKIQIDFNKDAVESYRLIGYENRILAAEDFHDDKKDAGEIGAGHTVTALYEIVPVKGLQATDQTRWMTVKLRYKQPEATTSELIESPLMGQPGQLKLASSDFQFAASVASFGMLLRNSQHAGQANWGMVKELAQSGLSNDQYGHRSGFRRLVDQAESLLGERRPSAPPEPEATVSGKYKSLLRRLNVPEDAQKYGQFRDYGFDQTKTYGGADNLPEGYWVYMAPYWYIWGESTVDGRK
jgi:Ca-activated chloride channel family protein